MKSEATLIAHSGATPLASTREHAVGVAWLLAAFAFRALVMVRYRIDSDEPQHLHVAWEWSRGLVAYRDFFDNHMPLFHLLAAPFIGRGPETSAILMDGRLFALPIAAALLVVAWRVARELFDATTAIWCTVAVSLFPPTLLKSVEFRNDNLTVVLCLAALFFVLAPLTARRVFIAGLLLGISFMTSIKTAIFAAALFLAVGTTMLLRRDPRLRQWRELLRLTAVAAAGFAIPVAIIAAWFAAHGALRALVFDTFQFNRLFPANPLRTFAGAVLYLPCVAIAHVAARHVQRPSRYQLLTGLTAVHFTLLLLGFWPLITVRDFLPVYPLIAMLAAAMLPVKARYLMPLLLIVWTVSNGELVDEPETTFAGTLDDVAQLTTPSDLVIDIKGETLFRHRATYFIFERVGTAVFTYGLLPETVPEDVVRARAYVAARDSYQFPPRTRRFLNQHYLSVGNLRVAGARPAPDGRFTIAIPGPYAAADGAVSVDGRPFAKGTQLAAGLHRITAGSTSAIVWAPALERGFAPR